MRPAAVTRSLLIFAVTITLVGVGLIIGFQREIADEFDPAGLIDIGLVAIILYLAQNALARSAAERTAEKELLTGEVRKAMTWASDAQNTFEAYARSWSDENARTALNRALKELSGQLSVIERLAGRCEMTLEQLDKVIPALLLRYRTVTTSRFGQQPSDVEMNEATAANRALYAELLMLIVDINRCG